MRFASFDEFGVRRIATRYQHKSYLPVFTPESEDEYTLRCTLQTDRVDAAILIAGRGLLGYEAAPAAPRLDDLGRGATLSDAIRVTGTYGDDELPSRDVLKRVSTSAFRGGGAEEVAEGWAVRGYAIAATSEACVRCHNGENDHSVPHPVLFPTAPRLVVGDPIGVAVFVTRDRD